MHPSLALLTLLLIGIASPAVAAPCRAPTLEATAARRPVALQPDGTLVVWNLAAADATSACVAFPESGPAPHRAAVTPCDDESCVRVHLPELAGSWAIGRYPVDVQIGEAPAERLLLTLPGPERTPWAWLTLYLLSALGLALSTGTLLVAKEQVRTAAFARRLDVVRHRLARSDEDHQALVARVRALLAFAGERLDRPLLSPRRLVGFDEFEPALREADQLLLLSERKQALWRAARTQGLPPTAAVRFNALLNQLDAEILDARLPVEAATFLGLELPAEARARALLQAASLDFAADVLGGLQARGDHLPPRLASQAIPDLPELLDRTLSEERKRLDELAAHAPLAPLALREVDLRLDVIRALEGARERVQDPHPPDVQVVWDALRRWRDLDLREPQPTDVHHDVLRALRWLPENQRVIERLADVVDPEKPDTTLPERPLVGVIDAPGSWSTFQPVPLRLRLERPGGRAHWINDTYLWRRMLRVEWTVQTQTSDGAVTPGTDQAIHRDGGTVRWRANGPATVLFAPRPGPLVVQARFRPPGGSDATWRSTGPLTVQVQRSQDERHVRSLQVQGGRRLLVNVILTVALAGLIAWQATEGRQGLLPYLWAFLMPFGVDLTTLAIPSLGGLMKRVLPG